jgi:probable F420-dependent oxidoreductase
VTRIRSRNHEGRTIVTTYKASIQVVNQHGTMANMRRAWLEADELGADVIFNCDHFFPTVGAKDGPNYEAWSLLGAMGEVTQRAQIGCLVSGNSYRNPNLLADMARTIDHISDGRLILGIGSGWMERDYVEYGYEWGTPGSRLRDLDRDMPVIRDRLKKLNPQPVNGSIPILIGGAGEKVTLRIVAQHADIWHMNGELEAAKVKSEVFDRWLEKVGRNGADIERAVGIKPSTMHQIHDYAELGFTHFNAVTAGPEWDMGFFKELLAWRDEKNRA